MLLKIEPDRTILESNKSDKVDWAAVLPLFFALPLESQIVVAFACDLSVNPFRNIADPETKATKIANAFNLSAEKCIAVLDKVTQEGNPVFDAAMSYFQLQNLTAEIAITAVETQIRNVGIELKNFKYKVTNDNAEKELDMIQKYQKQLRTSLEDIAELQRHRLTDFEKQLFILSEKKQSKWKK